MIKEVFIFVLKFLGLALAWTYGGRAMGIVYLLTWILFSWIKKSGGINIFSAGEASKVRKFEPAFPEYF